MALGVTTPASAALSGAAFSPIGPTYVGANQQFFETFFFYGAAGTTVRWLLPNIPVSWTDIKAGGCDTGHLFLNPVPGQQSPNGQLLTCDQFTTPAFGDSTRVDLSFTTGTICGTTFLTADVSTIGQPFIDVQTQPPGKVQFPCDPIAPQFTSGPTGSFTEGSDNQFQIKTEAFPAAAVTEVGALPSGVSFHDNGDGTATLSGNPPVGTAHGSSVDFPLTITASNSAGSVSQSFTLTVHISVPGYPNLLFPEPGNGSVTLRWQPPGDTGGAPLLGYNVYVLDASNPAPSFIRSNQALIPASTTSYTVTGLANLTNGGFDAFQVRAVNIGGEGPGSFERFASPGTSSSVPPAPTGTSATAPDPTIVILHWTAPLSLAPILGDQVYVATSPGGEPAMPVVFQEFASTSAVVTGLKAGTQYYFTVKAANISGLGPASSEVSVTTPPPSAPGPPRPDLPTPGNGQVTLTWSPPFSDGGSPVTGYNVYVGTSSGGENAAPVNATPLPASAASYVVSSLTNGTTYFFTMKAINSIGTSVASFERSATPLPSATSPPGAPGQGAPTVGDGQVTLHWSAPASDGGSAVTGYNVYMGTTARGEASSPVNASPLPAGATSFAVSGLTNGTTYFFTVKAINAVGASAASNEQSAAPAAATSAAPGVPSLGAPTTGDGQVTLSWAAPASDGGSTITGYNVYMGTTAHGEAASPVNASPLPAGATSFTVSGLTNGTTYYFTVQALNAVGSSPASSEQSATPAATVTLQPPPGPSGVYGTAPVASARVAAGAAGSLSGADSSGGTASVAIPAGALPAGSTVGLWAIDTSQLPAVPAGGYVAGFGVSWNPSTNATQPITLTIDDPTIQPGMTVYVLNSSGTPVPASSDPSGLPYATVTAGQATITFETDPGFVIAGTQTSPKQDVKECTGALAAGTYHNVHAQAGCFLGQGVTVTGDVHVDKEGTLLVGGATVNGDVHVDHAAWVMIHDATIGHDISIQQTTGVGGVDQICGTTVSGNLDIHENDAQVVLGGPSCGSDGQLSIAGHVDLHDNNAQVTMSMVHVSRDVDVHGNRLAVGPVVVLSQNMIDGNLHIHDNKVSTATTAVDVENNTIGGNLDIDGNKSDHGGQAVTAVGNSVAGRTHIH